MWQVCGFWHCCSTSETDFLKSYVRKQLFLNFNDIKEMMVLQLQFCSQKQTDITRGQIRQVRMVGDHSHALNSQKLLHTAMCTGTLTVKQAVLIPPLLEMFSVNVLPHCKTSW
jgi:hypothetical protein